MSGVVIVTCPRCFTADDVSAVRSPEGPGFLYTCANVAGHVDRQQVTWSYDPAAVERTWVAEAGVLDDLYDPLLAVLRPGDPYLEHGIIEERLRATAWDVFARHVDEAGHVAFGAIRNTASNRIGMALGVLRSKGLLTDKRLPGTGGWSFNPDIGFWALAPTGPATPVLTWAEHCALAGRSPDFTDDDRDGLTSQRQGVLQPWRPDHA